MKQKLASEKVWHFDSSLKPGPESMKEGYALITAGAKDTQESAGSLSTLPCARL